VADFVTPPYVAEMVTVVAAETAVVDKENFAEVAAAGTVIVAGTVTAGLELASVTTAPAPAAGPFSVTLLVDDEIPPTRAAGERVIAETATGLTVSVADLVTPPYVADTVTVVTAETALVERENFAEVAASGIVMVAGTVTAGLELARVT